MAPKELDHSLDPQYERVLQIEKDLSLDQEIIEATVIDALCDLTWNGLFTLPTELNVRPWAQQVVPAILAAIEGAGFKLVTDD